MGRLTASLANADALPSMSVYELIESGSEEHMPLYRGEADGITISVRIPCDVLQDFGYENVPDCVTLDLFLLEKDSEIGEPVYLVE